MNERYRSLTMKFLDFVFERLKLADFLDSLDGVKIEEYTFVTRVTTRNSCIEIWHDRMKDPEPDYRQ
jgi:hypothetical protein